MLAAVTGHDDVTVPGPDPGVPSRDQARVAAVAGEPAEPPREGETVALGDPARQSDVPSRAVLPPRLGGLASELVQPLDPLGRDGPVACVHGRSAAGAGLCVAGRGLEWPRGGGPPDPSV